MAGSEAAGGSCNVCTAAMASTRPPGCLDLARLRSLLLRLASAPAGTVRPARRPVAEKWYEKGDVCLFHQMFLHDCRTCHMSHMYMICFGVHAYVLCRWFAVDIMMFVFPSMYIHMHLFTSTNQNVHHVL